MDVMTEKTFNEIVNLAKHCKNKNIKWHFHMLGKDCKFNERKDKYCIVFENEESKEYVVSFFDKKTFR